MVFINPKIGNGFRINSINTSEDQDHYFSGAKKFIQLSLRYGEMSSSVLFQTSSATGNGSFSALSQNTSGTLYMTYNSGSGVGAYLLTSSDDGANWSTEDSYEGIYNFVVVDDNAEYNMYSGGSSGSASQRFHIRKSSDFGKTWSSTLTLTGSGFAAACLVSGTLSGTTSGSIFVGGNWGPSAESPSQEFTIFSASSNLSNAAVVYSETGLLSGSACFDLAIAPNNKDIYAVGTVSLGSGEGTFFKNAVVVKSDNAGKVGSWSTIYTRSGTTNDPRSYVPGFHCIDIDSSGNIYVGGAGDDGVKQNPTFLIMKGHITSSNFSVVYEESHAKVFGDPQFFSKSLCTDIVINGDNEREIYAVGRIEDNGTSFWVVKKSDDFGASGSFYSIYNDKKPTGNYLSSDASASFVFLDRKKELFVGGYIKNDTTNQFSASLIKYYPNSFQEEIILSASDNTIDKEPSAYKLFDQNNVLLNIEDFTVSFGNPIDSVQEKIQSKLSFVITPDRELKEYLTGSDISLYGLEMTFRDFHSNQWGNRKNLKDVGNFILLSGKEKKILYETSFYVNGKKRLPKFTTQNFGGPFIEFSVSTGSFTLTDMKLDFYEPLSNGGVEQYHLIDNQHNNKIFTNLNSRYFNDNMQINKNLEFPHSYGIFQMKNVVLGTTDSGKFGIDEDAIIQAKYFGSVVHVMWPDQGSNFSAVKGFGDFSTGQKPGKLTNDFVAGKTIDVENHDHLSLFCYLTKEYSGTLDNIEVIIERKGTKDTPFTIHQSVSSSVSSSFAVETLRDLRIKKEINYGDLSIKEIGYPIDVNLKNVKQLRISAKQTNGQSLDENKNFIVWGRLIDSKIET